MQNTKFLAVLSAAAMGLTTTALLAGPDTDEQAKMREALRQALGQPGAVAPAVTPAPPAPVKEAKPAPAPTVVVPIPVEAPVVKTQNKSADPVWIEPADDADTARMREALRQSLGTESPTAATVVKPAATPVVITAPAPAPAVSTPPSSDQYSNVSNAGADDATARMEEALRQAMAAQPAAPAHPAPARTSPGKTVASTQSPARFTAAPLHNDLIPSPFSAVKQQKLDALLNRYKADQITPQEYHRQRAEIIAEP